MTVDATKIFAYLTVPEDCRIGVCAHELGHLLFGFPDLYDTDNSSEGIGNWCLMAGGSWGGGGDTPVHPSRMVQGEPGLGHGREPHDERHGLDRRRQDQPHGLPPVEGRRGRQGVLPGREPPEDRRSTSRCPATGLLIWHIDDNQTNNTRREPLQGRR